LARLLGALLEVIAEPKLGTVVVHGAIGQRDVLTCNGTLGAILAIDEELNANLE
jgi:hypothetical protein